MNNNDEIINSVLSEGDNIDQKAKLEALKEQLINPPINNVVSDGGEERSNQKTLKSRSGHISNFLSNHTPEAISNKAERGYVDAIILASITALAGIILLVSIL